MREYPVYVLSMVGCKGGGGYELVDPSDEVQIVELWWQGVVSLCGWFVWYCGAFEYVGIDVLVIEEIVLL